VVLLWISDFMGKQFEHLSEVDEKVGEENLDKEPLTGDG
jgi:hypothetical protein